MLGGITYLGLAQGASAPEPGLRMLALVVGTMVTALVSGAAISRGGDVRGEFPSRGSFGVAGVRHDLRRQPAAAAERESYVDAIGQFTFTGHGSDAFAPLVGAWQLWDGTSRPA